MLHLPCAASSESTDYFRTCYLLAASGCRYLSGKLRIFYFSFESYLERLVTEFQNRQEIDLIVFQVDLLDWNCSVQSAHVRIDSEPLLASAPFGCNFKVPRAYKGTANQFSLDLNLSPLRLYHT